MTTLFEGGQSMRWMIWLLAAALAVVASPALADIPEIPDDVDSDTVGLPVNPIRAGNLEVMPIMSVRFSAGAMVYRAGFSVGYFITNAHQFGGSFVMGNRVWDRTNRREVQPLGQTAPMTSGNLLFVDEGFGSSLTGFYRLNLPIKIQKRTYPFLEVFAGRDFGWGDVREVGAGAGVRKFVGRRTAVTSQYAFTAMFADGLHVTRHVVTAGVSLYFN